MILFRAAEREVTFGVSRNLDHRLGWSPWFPGGFEIEDITGDHWHILKPPGVHELARRTAHHLARLRPR